MRSLPRSASRSPFPWITTVFCIATIGIHFAFDANGSQSTGAAHRLALLEAGAKSASLVSDAGEAWRVLSAHLVHTGWIHLAFNLAFLFPVACALECVLRRVDFALAMATIATAAGMASLIWTPEISAGASGLVYGVLSCAVLVGLRFAHQLRGPLRVHFGLWVLPYLVLILFFGASNPNLDHHNHLGGLLAGLVVLPLLRLRNSPAKTRYDLFRWAAVACILSIPSLTAPAIVRAMQPERIERCMGLEVSLPPSWRGPEPAAGCPDEPSEDKLELAPQVTFTNSSTVVHVRVTAVPVGTGPSSGWTRGWERYRAELVAHAGSLTPHSMKSLADDCPHDTSGVQHARCTQSLEFERDGIATTAELHWYRRPGHWLVIAFESPTPWWTKYGETRRGILGSIRALSPHAEAGDATPIVAAAIP